ncbi:hypothetical protein [Streptomyces niger]|uniref:hypothetical protein n=1 Tax=Streptomyces niger TaxID=66373 RepID=UPI00069C8080|nr:hypothetical protein [Streptomyces niger]
MTTVLVILALLFVLFVAAGVFVTVKAVSAAKRGVDRTVAQARRTVEDTTLHARRYTQPGPAGQLAELRHSLRTSMRATQEALRTASSEDQSLQEALNLFGRLSAHGHELDNELKRLEREPDRARIAACLPELRDRVERCTHAADSLRWAAQDRARRFADDDLRALTGQIDMEAGALRHWTPAPGARETAHDPGTGAAVPDPLAAWPPPEQSDASADRAEESPRAINARDPRIRAPYPWQKSARPENTG